MTDFEILQIPLLGLVQPGAAPSERRAFRIHPNQVPHTSQEGFDGFIVPDIRLSTIALTGRNLSLGYFNLDPSRAEYELPCLSFEESSLLIFYT
jgi:hypothetical protein